MKAPDKIYVFQHGFNAFDPLWHFTKSKEKHTESHEYIRKDALLDLVSKKKAQFIANGWPKKFLAGFDIMCDELIAELKSL